MIPLDEQLYKWIVLGALALLGFVVMVYVTIWSLLILTGADGRHLDMLTLFEAKVVPLGTFVFGLLLSGEHECLLCKGRSQQRKPAAVIQRK
jgi:hypothetical protein